MKKIIDFVLTPRWGLGLLALGCAGAMAFAMYQQYYNFIEPCPMCIMQRIAVMVVGIFALIFALFNPKRWMLKIAALLVSICALTGVGVAGRQLWLQSLPADQVPACGPGLEYMLETMPFWSVISSALKGTGDCAVVDWALFGLALPFWSGLFLFGSTVFVWLIVWKNSCKCQPS